MENSFTRLNKNKPSPPKKPVRRAVIAIVESGESPCNLSGILDLIVSVIFFFVMLKNLVTPRGIEPRFAP